MNLLSRRLHVLEADVLGFPPQDGDVLLYVGDVDEQLLHERAQKIGAAIREAVDSILDGGASPEQQNKAAEQLLSSLPRGEKTVLEQSQQFLSYRLERLVYKYFAAAYPEGKDEQAMLRVFWFFGEMQKLHHVHLTEVFEWKNNRDEDDPAFDDCAWWDALDAKVAKIYPEGVFTEKSYEKFERLYEEFSAHSAC